MDFSILDHCDLASVACWWWRRRIPVKRPLESLVPRLKIGGSLYTFTQKIVISLLWLTFDLEQSFSSEISRIYLPNNRPIIAKLVLEKFHYVLNFMYKLIIGDSKLIFNIKRLLRIKNHFVKQVFVSYVTSCSVHQC